MSFDSFYSQFDSKPDPESEHGPAVPDREPPRRRKPAARPEPEPMDTAPWPTVQAPAVSAYFLPEEPVKVKKPFEWNQRVVLLAGLGVALAALCVSFLVQPPGESVRAIRKNPDRFDGRQIMVRGHVGEVFPMGASCAYNLHQGWRGRDTIVVFSRIRFPESGKAIVVHGSVSMGYLDGQARPALFETPE